MKKSPARLVLALLAATSLCACSAAERLSRVGQNPAISPITNPTEQKDYRPVSMPMPTPMILEPNANSLWRPGARAFFKDQRAKQVGDVLTVTVAINNESATLQNNTTRTRATTEGASLPNFLGKTITAFGTGTTAGAAATQATPAVSGTSTSNYQGQGAIGRSESVNISLAAVVLQTLPNGNLAIAGRQEVRVNGELRELLVAGVIRPEDIASDNTIPWNKIAEARISYGGRGTLTDVQQPRYGQQIFDILFPF